MEGKGMALEGKITKYPVAASEIQTYDLRLCLLNCVVLIDSGCQNGGWSCCSSSNQCSIGEGDCDDDSECSGNLVCGTDNCDSNFQNGTNEQGEFHQQDCCTQATQGNKNNYLV